MQMHICDTLLFFKGKMENLQGCNLRIGPNEYNYVKALAAK